MTCDCGCGDDPLVGRIVALERELAAARDLAVWQGRRIAELTAENRALSTTERD